MHIISRQIQFLLTKSCSHLLSLFLPLIISLCPSYILLTNTLYFAKMFSPMLIGFGWLFEVGIGFVHFSFDSLR